MRTADSGCLSALISARSRLAAAASGGRRGGPAAPGREDATVLVTGGHQFFLALIQHKSCLVVVVPQRPGGRVAEDNRGEARPSQGWRSGGGETATKVCAVNSSSAVCRVPQITPMDPDVRHGDHRERGRESDGPGVSKNNHRLSPLGPCGGELLRRYAADGGCQHDCWVLSARISRQWRFLFFASDAAAETAEIADNCAYCHATAGWLFDTA